MSRNEESRVVFSTRTGDQRQKSESSSGPRSSLPPAQQSLKIMRDRKGRRGKVVTVITGFVLTKKDIKKLSKKLKTFCGAGGTVKEETIEIQGDHRERVADKLKSLGYKVKFAGG